MAKGKRATSVLVVDDNDDLTSTLSWLLEGGGFHVASAKSATECLTKLDAFIPDVVLLDLGMPGVNGLELRKRLQCHPSCINAKIVAHTGFADEASRRKAISEGFDGYLVKPVEWETLVVYLEHLRQDRRSGTVAPPREMGIGSS